jgi:nucleoside-diphosphate-sugar epimerase
VRVFVAGATGVLGRRLVVRLASHGHDVVGLSRRPENDEAIRSAGGEPRRCDLFNVDSLVSAAQGSEVVVRAATSIPSGVRFRRKEWIPNDRIRTEGTKALLEACAQGGAKAYVQEGIVWIATPRDGSMFDEDTSPDPRLWFGSAAEAEQIARAAGEANGFATSTVRFGTFYCADSEQTRFIGERLVRGKLPIVGPGDNFWSCTHVDDAADAMAAVIEAQASGIFHAVDNQPVSMTEFFTAFAEALGAPGPKHVPRWLARLAFGRETTDFLSLSTRTSSAKLRRELGWVPRYPTVREGFRQVVEAWRADGFVPGRGADG